MPRTTTRPDRPGERIRIWTGDLELHITADVAHAAHRHWTVSGDASNTGCALAPLLVVGDREAGGDRYRPAGVAEASPFGP